MCFPAFTLSSRAQVCAAVKVSRSRVSNTLLTRVSASETPRDLADTPLAAPPLVLDTARDEPSAPRLKSLITPHNVLLVNGRLAMMGMAAGTLGELVSHRTFAEQLLAAEPAVLALALLLSVASLVPFLLGEEEGDEVFGPFTPQAENLNGKVAIFGLVALLALEAVKGSPLL